MANEQSSSRLILITFGSLGDLHPFLAIGQELQKRNYRVIVATNPLHQEKTENAGLSFYPVRPDIDINDQRFVEDVTNAKRGPEFLIRDYIMPYLNQTYQDLKDLIGPQDILITHPLAYAAHAIAEKDRLPWISATLSPTWYFSIYDPPVLTKYQNLHKFQVMYPSVNRALFSFGKLISNRWIRPLYNLRKQLGLSNKRHPLIEGFISPSKDLALFSPVLSPPQPDWPRQTVATGFPFFNATEDVWHKERLSHFLKAGPAPVVFTLGSAVVKNPGPFFETGIEVVRRLGCRGIFLMEPHTREQIAEAFNPDQILIEEYIPYAHLFQHARVIVHQCGIGTTAQALLSGNPSLAVPYSNDQPDNAMRLERLGVARQLNIRQFNRNTLQKELQALINEPGYLEKARQVQREIEQEEGVTRACDEIEESINDQRSSS